MSTDDGAAASAPLALPDATTASTTQAEQLDVQASNTLKFDKLGPIVELSVALGKRGRGCLTSRHALLGVMRRPAFEETPAIRLKWFYEILEHETIRQRKRQRSSTSSFRSDVDDDLVPIYSPARRLERQRRREANSAFQVDWGLGDQSAIMPLPLESEYATWNGDHAMDEASDEPEEDLMVPSDMNEEPIETATDVRPMAHASEPHVIRLRHGQHLVRYVAQAHLSVPTTNERAPVISTRRKRQRV